MKKVGIVYLVGAGPGNAGLITVLGKQLLERCDVLVYDHLIQDSILGLAPESCEKIYVGKKARSKHGMNQDEINRLLVKLAKKGKNIVRLKGGDPFVFGRGGEEALQLKRARIPFEVVPGVTAGLGALAYAGIPVTHRAIASDATLITAHEDPSKESSQLNWKALAALRGTLVIYMGTHNLEQITKILIEFKKPKNTPAAVIEWGATAKQRTVTGTLQNIAGRTKKFRLKSPTMVVIGDVVKMRSDLNWYEQKPLFGKTVLITRSRHQASALRNELETLGAHVIEFPTIEIHPVTNWKAFDEAVSNIHEFDFLVLTSENGVSAFLHRLKDLGQDVRILKGIRILVIGAGTASRLNESGLIADLIPDDYSSEGLLESVRERNWINGKRYLLLRTNIAPRFLSDLLKTEGAHVTEVNVYETRKPRNLKTRLKEILDRESIDFLTFTSSSTAEHFFEFRTRVRNLFKAKVISIGPVTSATIRKFGMRVHVEANPHTIPGLVDAVLKGASKK